MKIKIGIVNVVSTSLLEQTGYAALQKKVLEKTLGPDVEIMYDSGENDSVETYLDLMSNPFFSSLDGKVLLGKLYKFQEEGCDGVLISCTQDPLLNEARSLLRIPVVGTIESSIFSACMAGSKFSFLVHRDRRVVEITEDLVVRYGLQSRMTPMVMASERYDEIVFEAFKNPELVRQEILAGCREVVEKGAHSVILASTALSMLATACGIAEVPEYGAPIFDPLCVGAQMLRYRIGLLRSMGIPPTSHAGILRPFPPQYEKKVMKSFGFAQ
jgi:allantoin racemase